jgi:hypothetical protein
MRYNVSYGTPVSIHHALHSGRTVVQAKRCRNGGPVSAAQFEYSQEVGQAHEVKGRG